ncbi:retrovirus-related pol polyprotein from transposon TNT 1-94 [Tanacetum coccineum]
MAEDGKLKIDNMMVMILDSVRCRSKTLYIRRSFRSLWEKPNLQRTDIGAEGTTEGTKQNRNKSKSWKIGEIKYRQNITCWNCNQKGHFQNQCLKLVASRDKEVNMARDSDDALVCCVENTVEDRIMDSGASFHATYCKEELERFKLRSGKVRLADDKTLDIAAVGDVVLKTSFGTSWTLKDVRIGMSMLASKGNVSDVQKVDMDLSFIMSEKTRNCRGWSKFIQKALALHLLHQSKDLATMILLSKTAAGVAFGVAERLSRTFRAESMEICVEAPKMLWADSVSTTYLIYGIPYVSIGLRIPEEEWRRKDTSRTLEVAQMKCDTAFGIRRVIENLRENDSIVAEHGLSSEIIQSPGGSSDMSEGSENSGSFKDNGRSDKEYSEDGASSKEGGFETPQSYSEALSSKESVQWKKAIFEEMVSLEKNQTWSLVRISAGKKASQRLWMFRVKEEQDGSKRYNARLVVKGFQQKEREPSYVGALNDTSTQHKSKDSWNEEPCSDVHQVGDEREVEALSSLNLPPRLLMNGGWCLTRERKVRAVALLKGRWFEVYRDYLRWRAVK